LSIRLAGTSSVLLAKSFPHGVEDVIDCCMAVRRNADRLASPDQGQYQVRDREGLAGSGRLLDDEAGPIEREHGDADPG